MLPGEANKIAFSRDGKFLAAGSVFGKVTIRDVVTGAEVLSVTAKERVSSISFSPDGKQLAFVAGDRVTVLDLDTGQELRKLRGAMACAFSPDGSILAYGDTGASGTIMLSEQGKRGERKMRGHFNPITSLSFSPDGQLLASGGNDNAARIWNVAEGKELQKFSGGSDRLPLWVSDVTFSPDGATLAYAVVDFGPIQRDGHFDFKGGRIAMRNSRTGEEIHSLAGHTQPISALAFSPDGKTLASAANKDKVKLWDISTGSVLRELVMEASDLAFSPDGTLLACAMKDGVRLLRMAPSQ